MSEPLAPDARALGEARVDKWLWAVRLFKTRTAATDACRGGHVKVNGTTAKPSSSVRPGDMVKARTPAREVEVEVTGLLEKRSGAPLAATCYVDHTPPPPEGEAAAGFALRDRGTGRPTKRQRRQLDRARRP